MWDLGFNGDDWVDGGDGGRDGNVVFVYLIPVIWISGIWRCGLCFCFCFEGLDVYRNVFYIECD